MHESGETNVGSENTLMRRITVYREDSTTTVMYQPVKHYWYEAGGRVLVISHIVGKNGEHDYAHWPMRRVAWFRDEKIRQDQLGVWHVVGTDKVISVGSKVYSIDVNSSYPANFGGRVARQDRLGVPPYSESDARSISEAISNSAAYDDIVEVVELAKKLDLRGENAMKLWLNVFRNNKALRAMSTIEAGDLLFRLGVSKRVVTQYIESLRLIHEPPKGKK